MSFKEILEEKMTLIEMLNCLVLNEVSSTVQLNFSGNHFFIYKNPDSRDMTEILKESSYIRGVTDFKKIICWPVPPGADHSSVIKFLDSLNDLKLDDTNDRVLRHFYNYKEFRMKKENILPLRFVIANNVLTDIGDAQGNYFLYLNGKKIDSFGDENKLEELKIFIKENKEKIKSIINFNIDYSILRKI